MIAKILKHAKGFSGVTYNSLKVELGKAEQLEVANFPLRGLNGVITPSNALDQLNIIADKLIKNGFAVNLTFVTAELLANECY